MALSRSPPKYLYLTCLYCTHRRIEFLCSFLLRGYMSNLSSSIAIATTMKPKLLAHCYTICNVLRSQYCLLICYGGRTLFGPQPSTKGYSMRQYFYATTTHAILMIWWCNVLYSTELYKLELGVLEFLNQSSKAKTCKMVQVEPVDAGGPIHLPSSTHTVHPGVCVCACAVVEAISLELAR